MYRDLVPPPVRPDRDGNVPHFACIKAYRRLFIVDTHQNLLVYTPPDFLRVQDRSKLQEVARRATTKGRLAIEDLIWFESTTPRAFGYSKRNGRR